MATKAIDLQRHLRPLMRNLAIATGVALLAAALALGRGSAGGLGIGVLIFLASALCGAVVGFLFAVPRLLDTSATEGTPKRLLGGNDNVSRVSDWLTTMLIGIGLTQLGNINDSLIGLRDFLGEHAHLYGSTAAPNAGSLPVIGPFLLILGAVVGFLYLYLHTRIELVAGFREAEEVLTGPGASLVKSAAATGAHSGVLATRIADQGAVTVPDAIAVMQKSLFDTGNAGFENTIAIGKALAATSAGSRADYWFYLAAAYGQMHAQLAGDPQAAGLVETEALYAAEQAVAIDPGYAAKLAELTDPALYNNDLATLASNPRLAAILK
jgi:hypothetical protein